MEKNNKSTTGNDGKEENRNSVGNNLEKNSTVRNDLPDSPADKEKLASDDGTMELPEVKDIPGQEFVHAPALGELADTTISSSDEEGAGILDDDDSDNSSETRFDVSPEEKNTLERTDSRPGSDGDNLQRASMDNVDFDGEVLNEKGFGKNRGDIVSGDDLDTNVGGDETRTTSMGQGDEENKYYSLNDDNDDETEGS